MTKKELLINNLKNITLKTKLENKALKKWIENIENDEFEEIKDELETKNFNITIYSQDCRELLNSVTTTEFCEWVNLYSQNFDTKLNFSDYDEIATSLVTSVLIKAEYQINFDEIEAET